MSQSIYRLIYYSEFFAHFLAQKGICVVPYGEISLEAVHRLEPEAIEASLFGIEAYLNLLEDADRQDIDLTDARQLSWSALRYMDLKPHSHFFDKIEKSDIVEFYRLDQVQTFRSLRFFELVSYDILSILTKPWHELYQRDSEIHEVALREMFESGRPNAEPTRFSITEHLLEEAISSEKRKFVITHKWRGPLFKRLGKRKEAAGVIMSSQADFYKEKS